MKRSPRNIKILQALTCLLPAGPLLFMAGLPWTGTALFAIGVVMAGLLQQATDLPLHTLSPNKRLQAKRLQVQATLATLSLAASAALMGLQTWDMTHGTRLFPWTHRNAWFVFLLIGALIMLYTSLRLDHIRRHPLLIAVLFPLAITASCTGQGAVMHYELTGRTNISGLEERALTLKVFTDSGFTKVNSAHITHGKFTFTGTIDSAVMAYLFSEEEVGIMPIVLEEGELTMCLNEEEQSVGGTPLNDTLNHFIHRTIQLDNQLVELDKYRKPCLYREGYTQEQVAEILNREGLPLKEMRARYVVDFIRRNFNTPLGPGIFMVMTYAIRPPTLFHPRVAEVMEGAPQKFTTSSYVNWYLKQAEIFDRIARENK